METKNKISNKLSNLLFFLSILFFTIGLNFQDNPPGGWYQQFIPDVNNMPDLFTVRTIVNYIHNKLEAA